jgi:hypothetical protein
LIYRRTSNLRAVQLLLGHTKIGTTVRYLGIGRTMLFTWPGRKNAPVAQNRHPVESPQRTPEPVRNECSTFCSPSINRGHNVERRRKKKIQREIDTPRAGQQDGTSALTAPHGAGLGGLCLRMAANRRTQRGGFLPAAVAACRCRSLAHHRLRAQFAGAAGSGSSSCAAGPRRLANLASARPERLPNTSTLPGGRNVAVQFEPEIRYRGGRR